MPCEEESGHRQYVERFPDEKRGQEFHKLSPVHGRQWHCRATTPKSST
jgi:hypothetical protein